MRTPLIVSLNHCLHLLVRRELSLTLCLHHLDLLLYL
jgi:hypothetical protein